MKRLCLLLIALLLLAGCSANLSGMLDVSGAPSAELGDRPGYRPEEVSGTLSTEDIPIAEPTARNMAFEPTATPGLYRIVTRTGDLKVLGMTYGNGLFFTLTKRESGIAVTGYTDEGTGVFAGHVDEELTDATLWALPQALPVSTPPLPAPPWPAATTAPTSSWYVRLPTRHGFTTAASP